MLISAALKQGDRSLVLRLIHQAHPYQINQPDNEGQTPLHLAVQKHDLIIIEALLLRGAQVDLKASDPCYSSMTPLHYAALTGDWSAANLLLQWGANADALNAQHYNPSKIAYQHGFKKVGQLIETYQKSTSKLKLHDRIFKVKQKTLEMRNNSIESLEARRWFSEKQASPQSNVVYLDNYRHKK